jgi:hypothetical protein
MNRRVIARTIGDVSLLPKSRRARAGLWIGLLLAAGAWLVGAVHAVIVARSEAQAGLDALDAAKQQLSPQDFLRGRGRDRLAVARAHFAQAHDEASSLLFLPVRYLPYLGRQMRSVEGLSGGATKVLDVGIEALTEAKAVVDSTHEPKGPQRIAFVRKLGGIAERASHELDGVSIGPGEALLGPLQHAHDRFAKQLGDLRSNVTGLADASGAFASFLDGSRYLVIAANNSEMRVGSGAFLSMGEMTNRNGHFTLGPMRTALDYMLRKGAVDPASVDADLAARWGFMRPADDFREVAVTGRFDAVAPLVLKMWQARTGHRLDGVLVLDPVALRSLLTAVGPVVVDGVTYTANNLLPEVFVNQYRGLRLGPFESREQARRERLSGIARAAIGKLEHGHWDTVKLVDAMRGATLGRHILLWSQRSLEERGWRGARLDGRLPADGLLLSIHNRGGNKLDQFLPATATLTTTLAADGHTDCTLSVDISNVTDLAHGNLPPYVLGPYPGEKGAAAGRYLGWVVAELPRDAYQSTMDLDGVRVTHLVTAGSDGPDHRVVAAAGSWDAGSHHVVTVHFHLPKGDRSIEIEPDARALNPALGGRPAVEWHFQDRLFGAGERHTVAW